MTGSNVEAAVRIGALVSNVNVDESKQINWSLVPSQKRYKGKNEWFSLARSCTKNS